LVKQSLGLGDDCAKLDQEVNGLAVNEREMRKSAN